ncbi:hypothetical protein CBM2585_A160251 [Cupriavidus taiwanensis]|nr:hypothetical protein CBM2585_A160251 [Cupriavidus taiwanensis]
MFLPSPARGRGEQTFGEQTPQERNS